MTTKTVVLKITNIKDLDKGLVEVSEEDIINNFSVKRLILKALKKKLNKFKHDNK